MVSQGAPEVISRTGDSVIASFQPPSRAAAAVGTSLRIGGREYVPEPTQSRGRLGTFYATDMTIGQILPGTHYGVSRAVQSVSQRRRNGIFEEKADGGVCLPSSNSMTREL